MSPVRVPKLGTVREYLRARSHPPAISREIVSGILEESGFGPPVSVQNLTHGWRTNVVMVTTADSRLVMRRYPERWSDSAIEHEHSLLIELAARNFPAPRLVQFAGGGYVRRIDGARYSVQFFEEGSMLTGFYLSRAEIERMQDLIGGVLAEFHDVLAGFVPAGAHHLGIDPETGRQRRGLDWHLEVVERLEGGEGPDSPFGDAGGVSVLKRRLAELDQRIEGAELPSAVIHGDYGLHNIILRDSGKVVVHDFELSRLDIRLLDLAASMSRVRPQFRSPFLDGFVAAGGVEGTELEMLEDVWEWYRIRGAIQSAEAYSRLGGEHRRAAVAKRLAEAGEIRAGREMVPGRRVRL